MQHADMPARPLFAAVRAASITGWRDRPRQSSRPRSSPRPLRAGGPGQPDCLTPIFWRGQHSHLAARARLQVLPAPHRRWPPKRPRSRLRHSARLYRRGSAAGLFRVWLPTRRPSQPSRFFELRAISSFRLTPPKPCCGLARFAVAADQAGCAPPDRPAGPSPPS